MFGGFSSHWHALKYAVRTILMRFLDEIADRYPHMSGAYTQGNARRFGRLFRQFPFVYWQVQRLFVREAVVFVL